MKNYFYFLLFMILTFSCQVTDKRKETLAETAKEHDDNKDTLEIEWTKKLDSIEESHCKCVSEKEFENIYKTDIILYKKGWKETLQLFDLDSLKKVTQSMKLIGFDTLPLELRGFRNVEKVLIESRNGVKGIDSFPKLKTVMFWGSEISINEKERWMSKIEYLRLEKTRIKNLSSIGVFQNLRHLEILHSGFESLIPEFDILQCLNRLRINAYGGDIIELRKIDLGKMPCLKHLYLQDAYNTLKGIPDNIADSNLDYIYVDNISMTRAEKKIIEAYQNKNN